MHRERRHRFLSLMQEGDVALFGGAGLVIRNHDVEFPFRQQSDFLYLTGFSEPDAALLLVKGVDGQPPETLFVLPRDPAQETWTGRRTGTERAVSQLGFEAAESVEDLEEKVREAVGAAGRLWWRLGENAELDHLVTEIIADMRRSARKGLRSPRALLDPTEPLQEMRLIKSDEELAHMRDAAAATAEAHLLAMSQTRPGMGEWQIEALLSYTFRHRGADGWAYPPIVAGGANACVLHYTGNDAVLRDGDLLLVDAGAEYRGYAADVTRTWPVNGRFTAPQRQVYELVLAAQAAALDATAPGARFDSVHKAALGVLAEGLRDLGVLEEPAEEILEKKLYSPWYMHNTSHWLGLDVHDTGRYSIDGQPRELREGMVLTVEPGLYFGAGDARVPEPLRGIGVRIEDDVRVTGTGREVLSAAIPKSIDDVEAACAAERVLPLTLDTELATS